MNESQARVNQGQETESNLQRQQVRDWVDEQIQQYPNTCFILTSRPYGYKSAPLTQNVTTLEVKPFSLRQMPQFLPNWYLQTEIMSRAGRDTPAVRSEAQNNANDLIDWTLDKEKTYLRNIYANAIGDNISSVSALFKAEKWLCQSVIE